MHVLLLPSWYPTHYRPTPGIFFRDQALALAAHGLEVGVVFPELRLAIDALRGPIERHLFQESEMREAGIPTLRIHGMGVPMADRLNARAWRMLAARLVRRYIERHGRPDLIHAHGTLFAGVAASDVRRATGLPFVVTEHSSAFARGMLRPWQRSLVQRALRDAARTITVSSALRAELLRLRADLEVAIVPNVIDTSYFVLPEEPRRPAPFTVLVVAALLPNKRVDLLLRAFAGAFRGEPDVMLRIAGEGPERRALEARTRSLGIAAQTRFLGGLSRADVRTEMWRANLFVLPSRVETFGVVLVEAMACGLPVIATRSGGPEDFVTPEVGTLIPVDDEAALSDALRAARAQWPRWEAESAEIRAYAHARFGRAAVASSLTLMYESLLAER